MWPIDKSSIQEELLSFEKFFVRFWIMLLSDKDVLTNAFQAFQLEI